MFDSLWQDLRVAYARQEDAASWKRALRVATSQGVWALGVYRYGRWLRQQRHPAFRLVRPSHFVLNKAAEILTGIKIFPDVTIGRGCYLHNFGGVVINGDVGEECVLVQGAQLLSRADGRGGARPRLGRRVYVGAGAKILGGVVIGDGAKIGANAVVLQSVPAGATAVGVPARIIRRDP
ncbi:MAG: serine acetyltransferase [Myxococcota bacterium]|jgi:serine O-acetyltransferase|nr:serine acetyltransferase [Myxococcota bacterium]